MHIQNITLTAIHRSPDGKRLWGEVDFDIAASDAAPGRLIKISCDIAYSNKIRPDAILVGDAVRQLRRLPELRSGETRLTFEPGIKPLAANNNVTTMDKQVSNG